jgi:hypothetical protein
MSADGLKISTSVLKFVPLTPDSSSPLRIGMRPSGRTVPLGYQRPWRMSGCSVQVSLNGLNV